MKKQIAIFAFLSMISAVLVAEPALKPVIRKTRQATPAAGVIAAKSGANSKKTASKAAKPKKIKPALNRSTDTPWRATDTRESEPLQPRSDGSTGVVDFMQPPVWAEDNYSKPVEGNLPAYMQPDNLNPKRGVGLSGSQPKSDPLGTRLLSDTASASPSWLPSASASMIPDYTPSLVPVRKLDLCWSAPVFGDGLPGWRMNTPSLDTPYMRVQRSQSDYQQARDSLEQLYQRWAPVKK